MYLVSYLSTASFSYFQKSNKLIIVLSFKSFYYITTYRIDSSSYLIFKSEISSEFSMFGNSINKCC